MKEKSNGFINHFTLKMIACIAMLIDHIGYIFLTQGTPVYTVFRAIGRISFPLFCFLIVMGFEHTRSHHNYLCRLLIFAFIAEIPFDLAFRGVLFDWHHQNVFFTLALGLMCLFCIEERNNRQEYGILLVLLWVISYFIRSDYGIGGVMLICMFYVTEKMPFVRIILCGLIMYLFFGVSELYGMLALPLIFLYSKKKRPKAKMIFYWFYPVHLIVLYLIHTCL